MNQNYSAMKNFFTILLLLAAGSAQAQLELGMHYVGSAPMSTLGENIQPVHSVELFGYGRLKFDRQFYAGGELTFGEYAHVSRMQTFVSPEDGSATITEVDYSSNIHRYHLFAGYDLLNGTLVIPYLTVKAGVSRFNTNIVIEDPEDPHGCHPLEEETALTKAAFTGGAGAGIRLDASSLFKGWSRGRTWIDFSANYLLGSSVDYVNVRYLDPQKPGPNLSTREIGVEFIDLHTQHIHEHAIAQVYTSTVNLLDYRIGIVKRFGKED
jgi:hypothetical protein